MVDPQVNNIRHPKPKDVCPCGTGLLFDKCTEPGHRHTPDELEYAWLVGRHYPDDMTASCAKRMLVLEKRIGIETLVDDEWKPA